MTKDNNISKNVDVDGFSEKELAELDKLLSKIRSGDKKSAEKFKKKIEQFVELKHKKIAEKSLGWIYDKEAVRNCADRVLKVMLDNLLIDELEADVDTWKKFKTIFRLRLHGELEKGGLTFLDSGDAHVRKLMEERNRIIKDIEGIDITSQHPYKIAGSAVALGKARQEISSSRNKIRKIFNISQIALGLPLLVKSLQISLLR